MTTSDALTANEVLSAASAIRTEGYTVLRNIVPKALLDRLDTRISELLIAEPEPKPPQRDIEVRGSASHRLYNVVSRDAIFREAALFTPTNQIVEKLLGHGYLIFASAVNVVGPGTPPQRLHTDDLLVRLPRPLADPVIINTIWAVSDFAAPNGATRLFPRSHLAANAPPVGAEEIQPELQRGSVLLYHGSLWHGSGANTTSKSQRVGLIFTFCARFIRPFENQLKLIPLGEARNFSPKLRQLIGFDYDVSDLAR